MIIFDFEGGPMDGQRQERPDSLKIPIFANRRSGIEEERYLAGTYVPGAGSLRGKMIWFPNHDLKPL